MSDVTCPLCRQTITGGSIQTADGGRVHIACAETHARLAQQQRKRAAVSQGLAVVGVVALIFLTTVLNWIVVASLVGLVVVYGLAHRRFWQLQLGALQRRWRLRR